MTTSALEDHLGYWLRLVSNHVSNGFAAKVESRGVTVAEWVVLRALLGRSGTNPSEIAGGVGLSRGAVSKLVDRLVAKGLVRCAGDKADGRFQVLSLTAAGKRLVPALAGLADVNDREYFGDMGEAERAALLMTLKGICERHGFRGSPVD